MRAVLGIFRKLRPWQIGGLGALLAVAIIAVYGGSAISGGSQPPDSSPVQETLGTSQEAAAREVPVRGRLVFPNRAELTFDTAGEVGEILVQEGDRVVQGQVLARLEDLTTTALERQLAQTQFDLDAAQEALERSKEEFVTTPLEQAQFEASIAQARKELDDAEERLADFQRDEQQDLATAMRAKTEAETALDNARRSVASYDRDLAQNVALAKQKVADQDLILDQAKLNLANFETDFNGMLANAQLKKAHAEEAYDLAEDNLTAFLRNPTVDVRNDQRIDLELLARHRAAFEEATTNLEQAEDELAGLQGKRSLHREERQAAVAQAEADLAKAINNLEDLEDEVVQSLELQQRQAAVRAAQAALAQAEVNLRREIAGSDQLSPEGLETAVRDATSKLTQTEVDLIEDQEGSDQAELAVREKAVAVARERLADLTDGPDRFDVAVKQSAVGAAQARVDDALEELEGVTVRAPFDGVISLVNVEVDDKVNDESRVLEIIDPAQVEVDGLIDAIDVRFVKEGSLARVTIASLPGQEFSGTVTMLAEEPRTERGVVSYPVRIKVDLPAGMEVPTRLSAVTSVIIYQGEGVPQQ
jgi:multidrug efflux pump subunit AcrA (membrane-fusion protein)